LKTSLSDFTFDDESHEGHYKGSSVKSVTTILREEGLIDTTWFTEYGRLKGSHTHQAILFDNEGDLDEATVDDAIRGRLEAARKFRAETGFVIIENEVRHFSEQWQFTGKPDVLGLLYGRKAVIDYKPWTLQWWTRYQLAGYEWLYPFPVRRYALRLGDDGRYQLKSYEDRTDKHSFLAILTTNRIRETKR
jgi:hypothetical protein